LRLVAAVLAVLLIGTPALAEVPIQGFDVVRDYPHDDEAFT